jgi:WD40 repeat protein
VFNSRTGKQLANFPTDSPPICIEHVPTNDTLVAACANMTIVNYTLDDPNPNRKHQLISSWATPGVQMSVSYNPANRLLYSGSVDGNIYAWNIAGRSHVATMSGHSDIVMSLLSLSRLNNVASASLDKTISIWDSFTNQEVLKLQGHRKGVLKLAYAPEYRLLISCGFEHEACVWSPFVNTLVYRLRGQHSSLVGCVAVEDTPEIITADSNGVFKLWDIRNFQCVQTFSANLTGQETKDGTKMNCISHVTLPPRSQLQKEEDFRVYGASKMLLSFDQERVVHEATTDFSNVLWMDWCEDTCSIVTASEKNVIIWDGLLGSKTVV